MQDTIAGTNTLVAVFNDYKTADGAVQELLRNGFSRQQVEMSSQPDLTGDAARGNAALLTEGQHSIGGEISHFFHRIFGGDAHEDDRRYYSEAVRRGGVAVVVHANDDLVDRAADILNSNGAVNIEEQAGSYSEGDTARDIDRERERRDETSIPVVREDLEVGKRAVRRGGVRVYSRVADQPVEEQVRLREEHVRVERRPADRPATDADLAAADREVVEVTETAEVPVVQKSARVVEEVVIGKDTTERVENVRDRVRRSDVRVEDTRGGKTSGAAEDLDADFRNDFRTRYGGEGRYEDYGPAYRYGFERASDAAYRGKSYEDAEATLRTDYLRNNPNSAWDRMRGAIRYGWEKATRKR